MRSEKNFYDPLTEALSAEGTFSESRNSGPRAHIFGENVASQHASSGLLWTRRIFSYRGEKCPLSQGEELEPCLGAQLTTGCLSLHREAGPPDISQKGR